MFIALDCLDILSTVGATCELKHALVADNSHMSLLTELEYEGETAAINIVPLRGNLFKHQLSLE